MEENSLALLNPVEAWQPWAPSAQDPWNLKWAGHLYRRAAFGGSPAELNEAVTRGLPATLDLLLKGRPGADDLEKTLIPSAVAPPSAPTSLSCGAWWLYTMLNGGRPAQRKDDAVLAQPLRHQHRQGAVTPR